MDEEWRIVNIPGCEKYSVSSMGNIRNEKGHIMKPTKQGHITLSGTNGKVRKYVHQFSCITFHGDKPSPKHTVDHIDRNWKNNNITNLRWASKSLQMDNKSYPFSKGFRVLYKTTGENISFKSVSDAARFFNIKKTTLFLRLKRDNIVKVSGGTLEYDKLSPKRGSTIKKVPSWILKEEEELFVSTCGLVKIGNNWTTGHESYRPVKYFSIGTKRKYLVHRLIASAFLGKPDDDRKIYVNHKDGNGFNNRIDNLEWMSPSENSQHAVDIGLKPGLHPVVQYNLDGVRLREFNSIREASRSVNDDISLKTTNIAHACKGKRPSAYNFMWRFKSEAPESLSPICRGSVRKEVRQYDLDGNLMVTYPSGREAAKSFGVVASAITNCCKGKISLGDFTLNND